MNRINRLRFKEQVHSEGNAYQNIADAIRHPNLLNKGRWRCLNKDCLEYLFKVCKPYWGEQR